MKPAAERGDLLIAVQFYENGTFEVIFRDAGFGQEVAFTGKQEFTSEQLDYIHKIAPSCSFSAYRKVSAEGAK